MTLLERMGLSPRVAPPPEMDEKLGYRRLLPYDVHLTDGDLIDIGSVRIRCIKGDLRVLVRGDDDATPGSAHH